MLKRVTYENSCPMAIPVRKCDSFFTPLNQFGSSRTDVPCKTLIKKGDSGTSVFVLIF